MERKINPVLNLHRLTGFSGYIKWLSKHKKNHTKYIWNSYSLNVANCLGVKAYSLLSLS